MGEKMLNTSIYENDHTNRNPLVHRYIDNPFNLNDTILQTIPINCPTELKLLKNTNIGLGTNFPD